MIASVLVVAGSDPLAYSGLEADLRHLGAIGGEGIGVVSAYTRQTSERLLDLSPVSAVSVSEGISAARATGALGAVKIGMLHRAEIVEAVSEQLASMEIPVVLDPVVAASGGARLLDDAGLRSLLDALVPLCSLLTPNLMELEAMGETPENLLQRGASAVLVKGGHGSGSTVVDTLYTAAGPVRFEGPRVMGSSPRGTGCALSTAIAGYLAGGVGLTTAAERSIRRVREAIAACVERRSRFLVLD